MKVTKRQLRQIIKEERAKLQEKNYALDRALQDMSFKLEDEINAVASSAAGSQWWRDGEALDAVMKMLDNLKETFDKYAGGGL